MGVIGEFYIVRPDEYSISKKQKRGEAYIRSEMVKTAQTFIGIPYKWGGSSAGDGFDCSGLVMAIYRLNGLKLPRTSFEQYKSGTYIDGKGPSKGDLVFFDTRGIGRVSHVGIYVGEGKFIHAPRTGKNVRTSSLSAKYYKDRYMGARTYL
jgi:cell wall-associated NlpC family hydrolase